MSTGKRLALEFKAKAALGALKGAQMVADRVSRFRVHPTVIHSCKKAVLNEASGVFERGSMKAPEVGEEPVMAVHAKIREIAMANFFVQRAQTVNRQVRRSMIEPGNPGLTIGKQCRLLSMSLPSFDDQPKGGAASNFGLMRQIDERPADVETPFFGIRQPHGTLALRIHCRTMDNIFAEHSSRSQVCECVCLYAWKTGSEVKVGIARWIGFYKYKRPHSALGGNPPAECIGSERTKPNPISRSREWLGPHQLLSKDRGEAHCSVASVFAIAAHVPSEARDAESNKKHLILVRAGIYTVGPDVGFKTENAMPARPLERFAASADTSG